MSVMPINWRPDRKALTEFGEFGMIVLGMVATPLALMRGQYKAAAVLWGIAVLLRLAAAARPMALKPAFLALTIATWPIGWVVSHLVMALIYFALFTPIALVFRLLGRDAMKRRLDRGAATYWEPYNPSQGTERYLRQY